MKTIRFVSLLLRWCGGPALALCWLASVALAQGIVSQTLTWTGTSGPALALNTPNPIRVTSSSGLPVTLTVDSGPATLVDGVLTITGPGRVQVTAEQPGDITHEALRETRYFNGRQAVISLVGRFDFAGSANGVEVVGDLAYVAGAGLDILDVSNPTSPVRVGRLDATTWGAGDVRVVGELAYLTSYTPTASNSISSLRILDVSNPASPAARGVADLGGDFEGARGVTVRGDHAYLATTEGGLQVFDIRNPAQPVRVGRFRSLGWAMATELAGHTAYLADRHAGLHVLDVSDPTHPVRLGGYLPDRGVSGIELAGNLAYLAGPLALEVLDISQPAHPVRVGAARLTDPVSIDDSVRVLARAGSLVFVRTFTGFEVVDVAEPTRPVSLGHQDVKWPRAIFARDQFVYVTSQEGNLQIFETRVADSQALVWTGAAGPVLDLHTPHPLQATAGSGLAVSFRVESGSATITDGHLTITGPGEVVVTAEQPGDPNFAPVHETRTYNVRQLTLTELGSVTSRNSTADVRIIGDLAYVADTTAGLQIINVGMPHEPVRVGSHATGGRATGVDVVDGRAYMAIGASGLRIIDVGDPADPVRLGTFSTGGSALKVQVVGNLAYVAANTARLEVIDVSNPAQPVRRSTAVHSGSALDVQVVDHLAYVAAGTFGLHIIDVTDPDAPVRLGSLSDLGEVTAVQVVGNRAYLAAGITGLQVLDVTDPAAPVRLGGLDLLRPEVPGAFPWQPALAFANAVRVVDGIAYVTTERAGLQGVDVTDPGKPVRLGALDTRNMALGVREAGGLLHLADGTAGLRVVEARVGYPQHLVWPDLATVLPPGMAHPVQAGVASGLPVTLRVETGPATITDGRLTVTGPGLVAVTAEQAGDDRHLPVRETRIFNVAEPRWDRLGVFTDLSGEALDVQVVGSRAYVIEAGTWENNQLTGGGLHVLDVSDPRAPVSLGRLALAGQVQQVAVTGNFACVAAEGGGLHVIDVSNPAAMTRVGGLNLGNTRSVHVAGNLAHVVAGSVLHVVDLTNPAQPVRIGGVAVGTQPNRVTVAGRYAYVVGATQTSSSLHIVDLNVPASPQGVGEMLLPGQARGVRVADDFAYVTSWGRYDPAVRRNTGGGLTIVDVRSPSNPVLRGRAAPDALSSSVDIVGSIAFLADLGNTGLHVLDVSRPDQPVPLGSISTAAGAQQVQVVGRVAYVATTYSGFQIIHLDLGLPQSLHWSGIGGPVPTLGTPYPLTVTASSGLPVTLRVASGPATFANGRLTAHGPGLIQVVAEQAGDEVFLPAREVRGFGLQQGNLSRVGEVHTGGGAKAVRVVGNLAYVLGEGIWDFSNPNFSRLVGGGLRIVDISNPARPTVVGELLMSGRMEELAVVGNRAYVVDTGTDTPSGNIVNGGLRIVDISNPATPALLGHAPLDGAESLSVVGDLAYLANWSETQVIDVSDPASPLVVATWSHGGTRVQVESDRAYLLRSQQLEVLDVSEPARPVRLGTINLPGYGGDVALAGDFAYVTSGSGSETDMKSQFQTFDVSDPARPRLISELSLSGAGRIRLAGQFAYVTGVADFRGALQVLDLSQPDQPLLLGGVRLVGYAQDVDLGPGVACVAAGGGLEVVLLNFRAPQPLRLELPDLLPFPGTPLASPASNPSGLPLAFTIAAGPARIENQQFIVTGLGRVTLRIEQPGDDRHLPTHLEWTVIVVPPTPRLRPSGTQIELSWPAGLPGLRLMHRETLASETPWQTVTAPVAEAEGQVRAILDQTGATGFFFLVDPE